MDNPADAARSEAEDAQTLPGKAAERPILAYQVGAFVEKRNADRLVAELFKAGFYGYVGQKTIQGRNFWAVTVEAPPNPFENFQEELLNAGFPSFPIR
jgi:cell division septation protein DedD